MLYIVAVVKFGNFCINDFYFFIYVKFLLFLYWRVCMHEGLISRVTRLISGSVNSVVDAVENSAPETVMKESIRELDAAIDDVRDELGKAVANKHHATKRLGETSAKYEDLNDKINLAVSENRDDLAKAAIAKQLDLEAQIPVLESAVKDIGERVTELEGYVAALQARRREMEEDLLTFQQALTQTSETTKRVGTPSTDSERKVEKAETAFDRVLNSATGIGSTVKTDRETAAKLAELETISRENRITERLAAAKAGKGTE